MQESQKESPTESIKDFIQESEGSCSEKEPFALQVLGNSMEDEFPENCIVIIEPATVCTNGMYIMVMVEGVRWFRQYIKDDEGERLVALHSLYPEIELEGLKWQCEGIIMQRSVDRIAKHYDYSS